MARFFGKYETEDDANKAWDEQMKKFGDQANELGTLRKQSQEMQATMAEWAGFITQVQPLVQWHQQNAEWVAQAAQQRARGGNGGQNPAPGITPQQGAQVAQAAGVSPSQWASMTPDQQFTFLQRAVPQAAAAAAQQILQSQGAALAKQVEDRLKNQYQHSTNVLWRTLERVLPKEALDQARAFHEESLKYADPSKLDPMELANQTLGYRSELESTKSELAKLKEAEEKRQKDAIPSYGQGSSARAFERPKAENLTDKASRFANVMNTMEKEVGAEAVGAFFSGPGGS